MRIVFYVVCAAVALVASAVVVLFVYSTVVPRKSLQELQLRELDPDGRPTVAVDGRLLGGTMAVRNATHYQQGSRIILLVRAGITRPGLRDATFHYTIRVPSGVDEICFGNSEDIIWRRKR